MSKGGRLSRLFPKFFKSDKTKANNAGDLKGPSCSVIFLDDSEQAFTYKSSWKGQILFDQICDLINLSEKVYFGLRFLDATGQAHWLDLVKSLSSQLKGCSMSHPKLYFGVKFYTADPCKLREEITGYLFFLQVKRDILQGRLPVSFEDAAELCAYAVQSELGDFDSRVHTPGYVSEFSFVPNQTEELEARIAGMHRRCQGATPVMAEQKFLEKVKWLEMYGVDLHPVQDTSNVEYFLGLTPTGIVVYKHKTKISSHFWPRVTKASHKGKVFTIKVKDKNNDDHVYAFELTTKSACKHLWKCCVEHHTFFSERSERLAAYDSRSREEPSVRRAPSRRRARRVNSDTRLNTEQLYQAQYVHQTKGMITMISQPQPVKAPRHRSLPELHGRQSPRSVKSAPWESKYDHGLYTSGHDSPASGRQTSFVSVGSDSESGISQRKRYFPSRKGSDNESDLSASRRRRHEIDSDSGSEVSFTNSGRNRKNRLGHRNLKTSDSHIAHSYQDKENNPHGSIPSIHSAPAGEVRQRRRRRRSKSPGNTKRPPEELKQHIEFDIVDTEGMTEEQLRDIPYTKVETKANLFRIKYSPKFRHKIWASRRKSFGSTGSTNKEGSGTNLSRQDSYNTDPLPRYVQNTKPASSQNQALVGNTDDRQEVMSHVSEQHKGNSSRAYLGQVFMNGVETPYDSSSVVRRRGDKMNQHFSDHEQSSVNRADGHQNRYEQNRLSYNEQMRQSPSEQFRQSSHDTTYKQNQPGNYTRESERRSASNERQKQLFSEPERYAARLDGYSHSPSIQNSSSYKTMNNHDFNRAAVPRSSGHSNTVYHAIVENSGMQGLPKQTHSPRYDTSQRGVSTLNRYNEASSVSPQKGASIISRYNETPKMGSQRGASMTSSYSETHTMGSQRGTSMVARYNETSVMNPQRDTSMPTGATARMNFDQRSTPLRPSSHNYEDQDLPRTQLGYPPSGNQNHHNGTMTLPTQQNNAMYNKGLYHPQYDDRQQVQISRSMIRRPPGSSERSPYSSNVNSKMNQESPTFWQGYARPQQAIKFRSDLVTQL